MTCHWFRHHSGVNCIPQLTCQLHQGLLAHGEHLTRRCQGWTDNMTRQRGLVPGGGLILSGRQVLHFRAVRDNRWSQTLAVMSGELRPGQPAPLLKRRRELSREEAFRLWR
jgi:hypothetical protein